MKILTIEKPAKCPLRRAWWGEEPVLSIRCRHPDNKNKPCTDDEKFPDNCPGKNLENFMEALWNLKTRF